MKHVFLLEHLLKYILAKGKLYFGHLFRILDFSKYISWMISKYSVDLSFLKHRFLLGLGLKYVGLRKTVFGTAIWDSGFQQLHIHIVVRSQFYKARF